LTPESVSCPVKGPLHMRNVRSNAPKRRDLTKSGRVRVIHPFHPLAGRDFEFVKTRKGALGSPACLPNGVDTGKRGMEMTIHETQEISGVATTVPGRNWSARWEATGPVVAITGSSKGIGRALALGLAGRGAKVALLSRDGERIRQVSDEINRAGGSSLPVVTDVTDEASVERATRSVVDRFGALEGMVVNAGIAEVAPAIDTPLDSFRRVIEVNLVGAFISARAAARHMLDAGGGSIVIIGSTFATSAVVGWASYAASKAGAVQLGRVLALEWASRGVRVNAICPTATLTDQNRELFEDDRFRRALIDRIPMGRLLEPDELVDTTAFLLGEGAAMITGQALYVDGGWTLP